MTVCKIAWMLSSQSLSEDDRKRVAAWAADCAERVLPLFESEAPGDGRPGDAIARARGFAAGRLTAAVEIRQRFVAGRAATSATSRAGAAAARSAAQAAAVAHMGAHGLGAAAYAARAIRLSEPDSNADLEELEWQIASMRPDVAVALRSLPLLGSDSAGPLGPGLLSSGDLGDYIRSLQARLHDTIPWARPGFSAPILCTSPRRRVGRRRSGVFPNSTVDLRGAIGFSSLGVLLYYFVANASAHR